MLELTLCLVRVSQRIGKMGSHKESGTDQRIEAAASMMARNYALFPLTHLPNPAGRSRTYVSSLKRRGHGLSATAGYYGMAPVTRYFKKMGTWREPPSPERQWGREVISSSLPAPHQGRDRARRVSDPTIGGDPQRKLPDMGPGLNLRGGRSDLVSAVGVLCGTQDKGHSLTTLSISVAGIVVPVIRPLS